MAAGTAESLCKRGGSGCCCFSRFIDIKKTHVAAGVGGTRCQAQLPPARPGPPRVSSMLHSRVTQARCTLRAVDVPIQDAAGALCARAPDGGAAPGPLGRLDGGFLVTRLAVVQTLPPNLSTWRASWGAPTPCHSSTRSSQPGSAWEQLGALPGCPAPGGSENRSPPASHLERLVGPPAGAAGGAVSTLLLAQGLDPAGAGAGGEAGERQGAEPHVLA